ncbi:hypothetical protein JRO89_XS08G0118000 [Xanthoceras sorbifolium]|uniref:Uncharacterized protein n=1 Tax=Xanthoceras sorbifolium TaxID=99658 RepID=A0ABQ8HPE3_9ROSI|nr:hypothetical protein JRO89_XS08G0118000 [Xanthoceras sorbifolium]
MKPKVLLLGENKSGGGAKAKRAAAAPPPPPPLPPLPRFWANKTTATQSTSVTNQEIARFWRQKRIDEEDHLLAAIKAAARIRARNLSEDYKYFEESLKDDDDDKNIDDIAVEKSTVSAAAANSNTKQEHNHQNNELRLGIKDWWTKSKYAYLNQPAINSVESPKKRSSTSNYTPNCISYKPVSLYPSSLGVF